MENNSATFLKLTATELFFNNCIGRLVDWGMGPKYMQILEVAGRKSGKIYRTPVNLMNVDGMLYLVAPRGETSWVRNARHADTITLKRGSKRVQYRADELSTGEKAPLLKEYLDRYKSAVQRYFSIEAGSDVSSFHAVEAQYPIMRLEPI